MKEDEWILKFIGKMTKGVMLCKEISECELEKYLDSEWIFEEKIDGGRAKIIKNNGSFDIINRRGISYKDRLIELKEDVTRMSRDVVLDGEVVASFKRERGFHYTQRRTNTVSKFRQELLKDIYPIEFIAFDILSYDGEDLRNLPLIERKKMLDDFFQHNEFKFLKNIKFTISKKRELLNKVKKERGEGIVLKHINSPYLYSRSHYWVKMKNIKSIDIKFASYEENNKGITLISDKGIRVLCGGVQSKKVKEKIDKKGKVVCEIKYLNKEPSGLLRQPTFKVMR